VIKEIQDNQIDREFEEIIVLNSYPMPDKIETPKVFDKN
jgi:hypothetical protein